MTRASPVKSYEMPTFALVELHGLLAVTLTKELNFREEPRTKIDTPYNLLFG